MSLLPCESCFLQSLAPLGRGFGADVPSRRYAAAIGGYEPATSRVYRRVLGAWLEGWYVRWTDENSDNALQFRILGPIDVVREGQEVAVGAARQRAVLAALLVWPNQVVSSDRLIDDIWGERAPETAATQLHGLVSQLRKALEPNRTRGSPGTVLATRPPGYVLRVEPEQLDAARFERLADAGRDALARHAAEQLREALALWRGHALADAGETAVLRAEAVRLEELRLEALEDRIDADLALGRHEQVVPELEAVVGREPLRERPRAALMLALYRSGRKAEALEIYQRTRRAFVDSLGIEPTPRLRELEQAILRQDRAVVAGMPRSLALAAVRRRPRLAVGLVVTAVTALAGLAAVLLLRGDDAPVRVERNSVAVVDPASGKAVGAIGVGSGPIAVVSGHGSLWVANNDDETVTRIDPATRDVEATIGVGAAVDLAVGTDAVWVANGIDGTVSRIDPASNDRVATIDLRGPDQLAPDTVQGIDAGGSGVWAVTGSHAVRIDPATNTAVGVVRISAAPLAVGVGPDAVWVLTGGERLVRLEPRTGELTGDTPVGDFVADVALTDDGVLVVAGDVWRVDPSSGRVLGTYDAGGRAVAVADAPGPGIWAANAAGGLVRIDFARSGPVEPIAVGREPSGLAVVDGEVWIAVRKPVPWP